MYFNQLFRFTGISIFFIFLLNACKNEPEPAKEFTFETVNGFVISEKGEKLLATDNGLFLLNSSTGKFEYVGVKNNLKPLNDINWLVTPGKKELWLATDSGVFNFTGNQMFSGSNIGQQNNPVTRFDFDRANRGIFATLNGISILDNNKWTKSSGSNDIFLQYEITDVASAINGFTYITTKGGGVERIEFDADGISGATVFDTDWSKLESNYIHTVYIDSIMQVYGTDSGVAIHTSEFTKWDWEIYTSSDGLISNNVISVVKDKSGSWWFGTTNGISRLSNSSWTNFTAENSNIISNNIKFLAVDTDGTVWFASDEGLSQFVNNKWINYSK